MLKMIYFDLLNPLMTGAIESDLKDEELIVKYLDTNNMQYYSVLYDRYSRKVFGKCISILKSESLAEDATQDIFIKILLNLSKFKFQAKFSSWIYSITYNYCIDSVRRRKKDPSVYVDDIGQAHDTTEEVSDSFLLETNITRLKKILNEIPVADKAILMMKYQDGMPIIEISKLLDKSESAIKMQLKRAKEKFKKVYFEIYKEVEL